MPDKPSHSSPPPSAHLGTGARQTEGRSSGARRVMLTAAKMAQNSRRTRSGRRVCLLALDSNHGSNHDEQPLQLNAAVLARGARTSSAQCSELWAWVEMAALRGAFCARAFSSATRRRAQETFVLFAWLPPAEIIAATILKASDGAPAFGVASTSMTRISMATRSGIGAGTSCACALLLVGLACGSEEPSKPRSELGSVEKSSLAPQPALAEPPPIAAVPVAIEGTVVGTRGKLRVQDCAQPSCPKLLHAEAQAHCAGLELGALEQWRLPTKSEAAGLSRIEGLSAREGYHWTASAFDADAAQYWIVDPAGAGPSTTIPGTRKAMRVRCVHALVAAD